jgi:hypothetical protein
VKIRVASQSKFTPLSPSAPIRSGVVQRKCSCSGMAGPTEACVRRRHKKHGYQATRPSETKLTVNQPGDRYEPEADSVAGQVMHMSVFRPQYQKIVENESLRQTPPLVQQHASNVTNRPAEAPPIVQQVLHSPGQPLQSATREIMESRLGHDFSQVRIHHDAQAAESARAVQARAYTVGRHVVFGAGQYMPASRAGRGLIAHELAHVVQQQGALATSWRMAPSTSGAEREAQLAGRAVGAGNPWRVQTQTEPLLARNGDDYARASAKILKVMDQMGDELAQLRSNAPQARGPRQEASRTFAVVKVVDADGTVKQTATGQYLGRGLHAEEQALRRLNLTAIRPSDAVLVMVDQFPCEDKCTPALKRFRDQTQGEFRVFHKIETDPETGRVVRQPKTVALQGGRGNQLMELTEFHRGPRPPAGGGPGRAGGPSSSAGRSADRGRTATPAPRPGSAPSGVPETSSGARQAARRAANNVRGSFDGLRTARILGATMATLGAIGDAFTIIEFTRMTENALSGRGFKLIKEIGLAEKWRQELNDRRDGYKTFRESITENQPDLWRAARDPFSAGDAAHPLADLALELVDIRDNLKQRRRQLQSIRDEAQAKHDAIMKILQDPHSAGPLAALTGGSATLANLFAVSQDMQRIAGAVNGTLSASNTLKEMLDEDISFLNEWSEALFTICIEGGACTRRTLRIPFVGESTITAGPFE